MNDLISRQDAIDAVNELTYPSSLTDVKRILVQLPPAHAERKNGHWVYSENGMDWNLPAWICSECRCRNDNIPTMVKMGKESRRIAEPRMWQGSRFCPNCGAKMFEEEPDNSNVE